MFPETHNRKSGATRGIGLSEAELEMASGGSGQRVVMPSTGCACGMAIQAASRRQSLDNAGHSFSIMLRRWTLDGSGSRGGVMAWKSLGKAPAKALEMGLHQDFAQPWQRLGRPGQDAVDERVARDTRRLPMSIDVCGSFY
jgi:hypothetical protein